METKNFRRRWQIIIVTTLSIAAFLAVVLYQQLQNQVEKLGNTLVTREDFHNTRASLWDVLNKQRARQESTSGDLQQRFTRLEVQAQIRADRAKAATDEVSRLHAHLSAVIKGGSVHLNGQLHGGQKESKNLLDEVGRLRERLASLESRNASPTGIRSAATRKSNKGGTGPGS
jgi:hypothetical protein